MLTPLMTDPARRTPRFRKLTLYILFLVISVTAFAQLPEDAVKIAALKKQVAATASTGQKADAIVKLGRFYAELAPNKFIDSTELTFETALKLADDYKLYAIRLICCQYLSINYAQKQQWDKSR